MNPMESFLQAQHRRQFLRTTGVSLGSLALADLLAQSSSAATLADPLAAKPAPRSAKAKSIIYLHMIGAPSHLDLWEPKPKLVEYDGQKCPESLTKGKRFAFIGGELTLAGSKSKFERCGQAGHWFSEKTPYLAGIADDLTFIRSLHTHEINHAPAQMLLHSGFGRGGRPSLGSWVVYGLGSESQNLPAYVVMLSGPAGGAGANMWSAGFLPSVFQGVQFRGQSDPVFYLSNPAGVDMADRRKILDAVAALNQHQLDQVNDPEIATRINQYEMAFRMQTSVPELADLTGETKATLALYGANPKKASFANNCLMARRLVERGVRMVELYDADWDHHNNIENRLSVKCKDVDQAIAGLITDLKRRGLLDDTLVVWGQEFGRTPLRQGIDGDGKKTPAGRDHHKDAFTLWMTGGGIKPGVSHGATDDMGFEITENPVHVHDLNATILHLLGLDHEKLTYRYQGREFRLTDVEGNVVKPILRA